MMSDEILSLTHKIPAVLARTVIFTRVEVGDTRYTDCGKLAAVQQCGWSLTLPRVKCRTVAQRQRLATATCPWLHVKSHHRALKDDMATAGQRCSEASQKDSHVQDRPGSLSCQRPRTAVTTFGHPPSHQVPELWNVGTLPSSLISSHSSTLTKSSQLPFAPPFSFCFHSLHHALNNFPLMAHVVRAAS